MKLIYIYGPLAVGKLEVAKELSKITNFRIFHNHLTADYVSSIFPIKDEISNKLKQQVALKMFNAAAKYNVEGLIFTKVYDDSDKNFVKRVIEIVEKYNGEILFVKLYCKEQELYERVVKKSRQEFDKIHTKEELKSLLEKNDKFGNISFKESLVIDNTNLPAKECAKKIKEHYKL